MPGPKTERAGIMARFTFMESEKFTRMHELAARLRAFAAASPWNAYRVKMLQAAALLDRQADRLSQNRTN